MDHSLFTLGVEVYAAHVAGDLIETDVVEPLEGGTRDGADLVVRHQEVLLPPHEEVLLLGEVPDGEVGLPRRFRKGPPRAELGPVLHVDAIVRTPFRVLGVERELVTNDLALEEGGEGGMVLGQA